MLQEIFTMKNKTNILQLHFHRFCLLTTVQLQQEILAALSTCPCLELAVNSIVDEGLLSVCFDHQNLKIEIKPVRFFAKQNVELLLLILSIESLSNHYDETNNIQKQYWLYKLKETTALDEHHAFYFISLMSTA